MAPHRPDAGSLAEQLAAESLQSLTPELVRRLPQVLEAMVAIGADVDLRTVLDRIVRTAAALTDARHAAIGVLGAEESAHVEDFITHGDAALMRRRVRDRPDAHLLSVPIRVQSEPFGHLYLSDKSGGQPFTDADLHLVRVVATEAGIAIGHARLLESARQRARWIDGSAALTTALLRGTGDALSVVAEQARRLADAAAGLVFTPTEEGGLRIVAAAADDPDELLGLRLPPHSPLVGALLLGEPVFVEDCATDPRLMTRAAARYGPSMMLPLGSEGRILGMLAVPRSPDAPLFTATERTLAQRFASQAALALLLAEAGRDRERLAVYEDRDRIARDLHDLVIQRLFATGMMLEGAQRSADRAGAPEPRGEVRQRITQAVDELDATVREIRTAIYALQQGPVERPDDSLRSRVLREVRTAAEAAGFPPSATFTGMVDSLVGEQTARNLVAAAREALSNAVRHAAAGRIEVTVDAAATLPDGRPAVRLAVADDGAGLPPGSAGRRHSGLANLHRRAQELGGTTRTGPGLDGAGTTFVWEVPL
ncbi:sensor histidine kinase [Streptomyces sp. WMMC897]|uniref:sensor histidine kinase n=1 Tax=Streptomyces sp. WMMC897 TaxID=3014782 RepID=UPI0022B73034|nr:GAF domain-containing protein [Streptomyces sp. WMMC897]MCZ7417617.1 GAF domain-containing protein [Streptomyces sp. WMMC897]